MLADDLTLLRKSRSDAVLASLPTLAYAIGAIGGLRVAAYAGIGCALVVCAVAARKRPLPSVAGLLGVVLAVAIAVVTRRPTAFFLPGIVLNAVLATAGALSVVVRRPALAFTLGSIWPRFANWRNDQALRRIAAALTVVWSAVFLLRFVVMGACYLAGAAPSMLAVVKIVLGLPLAAIAAAISLRLLATDELPNRY
ncbi:MAG: DUF3159 domain-containing protein [Acidothermaceae bacterium]